MARVNADRIVDSLEREFKKALSDTFAQFAPDVRINDSDVFRYFNRRVDHHCSRWETVPDDAVET